MIPNIAWKEGLALLPHHFQRSEEASQERLLAHRGEPVSRGYGFSELAFDERMLGDASVLVLSKARGTFPSGVHFDSAWLPAALSRQIPPGLGTQYERLTVFLAMPLVAAGAPALAPDIVPTVQDIHASPVLAGMLSEVLEALSLRLSGFERQNPASDAAGMRAWHEMLQLRTSQARLEHLRTCQDIHPERLYTELVTLAGALAMTRSVPGFVPGYRHGELSATLAAVMDWLRAVLHLAVRAVALWFDLALLSLCLRFWHFPPLSAILVPLLAVLLHRILPGRLLAGTHIEDRQGRPLAYGVGALREALRLSSGALQSWIPWSLASLLHFPWPALNPFLHPQRHPGFFADHRLSVGAAVTGVGLLAFHLFQGLRGKPLLHDLILKTRPRWDLSHDHLP